MRVIKKGPNQILIDVPQWLGRLVGLFFLSVGIFGGLYFNSSFVIQCSDKQPGEARRCRVYNPVLAFFGYSEFYQQIDKAKIIARQKKGDKEYSLRLYADDGRYFLTKTFTHDRDVIKRSTDMINQYIQAGRNHQMTVPNFVNTGNRLIFVFFVPFSLIYLYVASANQLIIDRNKRQILFQKKFLGLVTIGATQTYAFADIDRFEVEESYNQRHGRGYQLVLRLTNGDYFAVNTVVSGYRAKFDFVNELNDFLHAGD